jgi:hypothetical protein
MFLSLGFSLHLGRQLKWGEHHRNQKGHAGDLQTSGPTGRAEKTHRFTSAGELSGGLPRRPTSHRQDNAELCVGAQQARVRLPGPPALNGSTPPRAALL